MEHGVTRIHIAHVCMRYFVVRALNLPLPVKNSECSSSKQQQLICETALLTHYSLQCPTLTHRMFKPVLQCKVALQTSRSVYTPLTPLAGSVKIIDPQGPRHGVNHFDLHLNRDSVLFHK